MHKLNTGKRGYTMRNKFALYLSVITILVSCAVNDSQIDTQADLQLIEKDAELITVDNNFLFTEGPVANSRGDLFFTDIENNRVHKLSIDGSISIVYEPSNRANGLTMDLNGDLLICEQSAQRITRMDSNDKISVVAESYNGNPLNSPNDIWVHPDGGIYFTDPRYSWPEGDLAQDGEHVYFISPDRSAVKRVISDLKKPNGIIGTENGQTLYVADTQLRKVLKFDISTDGSVRNKQEFVNQGSDGMTIDQFGNIYLTWFSGVSVYNPDGRRIEFIRTPQTPANVGFGGGDRKTLFITARTGLYSLRMNVRASR